MAGAVILGNVADDGWSICQELARNDGRYGLGWLVRNNIDLMLVWAFGCDP